MKILRLSDLRHRRGRRGLPLRERGQRLRDVVVLSAGIVIPKSKNLFKFLIFLYIFL